MDVESNNDDSDDSDESDEDGKHCPRVHIADCREPDAAVPGSEREGSSIPELNIPADFSP